ncbi:hypothetical protein [Paraburkholderia youngii]|uniref:hypothetical protein n=1 Tax=Paraburkholderia youngii TaxID=2782701 RepID=UPI003D2316E9
MSGTLRFDRRSIPAELSDIGQWPTADDSGLDADARSLLARRIQAMTLFVDGSTSLRAIGRETGLRINDLYRLFERCITRHEDGRIYGCRALLPWLHTQPYERSATVKASGAGGASGAFAQLLQRYPDIAQWIERKVAARSRPHATLKRFPARSGDCTLVFLPSAGRRVSRRTNTRSTRNTSVSDRWHVT